MNGPDLTLGDVFDGIVLDSRVTFADLDDRTWEGIDNDLAQKEPD